MNVADYSGNTGGMSFAADAQVVQGISGNAVYLPSEGYGYSELTGSYPKVSVSLWRKWDGVAYTGHERAILAIGGIHLWFAIGSAALVIQTPGMSSPDTATFSAVLDDTGNHLFCINIDAELGTVSVFRDTVLVGSVAMTVGVLNLASESLRLGNCTSGDIAHATFDEFRVYQKILTEAEIEGLFRIVSKGYNATMLSGVVSSTAPKYAGTIDVVPATPTVVIVAGPKVGAVTLNKGDWVLMVSDETAWTQGRCYKWTAAGWAELDPEAFVSEYQAALIHLMAIPGIATDTGYFGAIFARLLLAQQAAINELQTKIIHLQAGGVLLGGDRYDETGAIVDSAAKGVCILADGTIKAHDGFFSGTLGSDNKVEVKGYSIYLYSKTPPYNASTYRTTINQMGISVEAYNTATGDFDIDEGAMSFPNMVIPWFGFDPAPSFYTPVSLHRSTWTDYALNMLGGIHGTFGAEDIRSVIWDQVGEELSESVVSGLQCTGALRVDGGTVLIVTRLGHVNTSDIIVYGLYANGSPGTYTFVTGNNVPTVQISICW